MTNFTTGAEALAALNSSNETNKGREFTSLKSGSKFIVRIVDKAAVQLAYSYGIFKQVNSFVAKEPSIKTPNGFPTDNLTPWDKAYKYHKDKSKDFNDEHGQEANKYRAKQRFAMAFFDLNQGEYIIADLSKKQAQAIATVISKNESKLGKKAFELEKVGSGTSTSVMLSPLDLEDLTEMQRLNFDKAPAEFDQSVFYGIWYEQNETQMIELLKQTGFDVSLVGFDSTSTKNNDDDPLPF